jgi:L-Ala-D/L-Glu epimerase / N-acetyl-D-glutamate racemase
MIIQAVELIRVRLPFHEPFRISISTMSETENIFVRLITDDGPSGIGESSPSPAITGDTADTMMAAGKTLARRIIGRSPWDIEALTHDMARWLAGHPTMRSGFDMALYDLASKAAGLPLYRFLGGGRREFRTDNTVGMDTPERMAAKAREFVADGYGAIKAKVGTGYEDDVARVRQIRAAIGPDIPVRIDANQGWDVTAAIRILSDIAPSGIEYCEQPVPRHDLDGLRRVRDHTSIPIMADESVFDDRDALRLVKGACCDYLNIKLSKSAGIHTALRVTSIAEAAGMACMVGCMSETRLGLSAAAHFISARPIVRFADLDSHVDHTIDPVLGGVEIDGDAVRIPETPGHGSDLDPGFVASCETETIQ